MPTTTSRGRPTVTTTIDCAEINRRDPAMRTEPRTPVGPCRSGFMSLTFSLTPIRSDRAASIRLQPDTDPIRPGRSQAEA
jgi:hypothetical protein